MTGTTINTSVHLPGGMPVNRATGQAMENLIDQAKDQLAAMGPAEREAMYARQRESFARGMSKPCEHGILDFEQCPECRAVASKSKGQADE